MDPAKQARLEAKGWRFGAVTDFLGLTPDEETLVEVRVRLAGLLRQRRTQTDLSQKTIAKRIGSSQSRIAKVEANDPTVSTDLLLKAVAATGATAHQS
jgi:predicted XRE-type DNA-binding protein